ncbi:3-oxoacyl-ACP reductase FabG [Ruminococcaceae bacterium OttesenSCG-928-A16]|nr:3-oxoacyl-ACP reductase FabG [Ruminococcaceae bacterium OttesenSCG-928-A16]
MGRCVLVTGASGGIGAAIATAFAKNGDNVVLGYHKGQQKAQDLCTQLTSQGLQAVAAVGNVANAQQVQQLFAKAEAAFGPVEVLVNNAGVAAQRLFTQLTEQEWDEMFDVHVKGNFLCTQRALPGMLHRKNGCIINISSMWGQVGASCEAHYAAAKAAVIGLTKALAKEEGPSGIRVNCIAPGAIDTAMMQDFTKQDKASLCEEIPLGRIGTPEEVAGVALFLASDAATYVTGQVIAPNGGFVV